MQKFLVTFSSKCAFLILMNPAKLDDLFIFADNKIIFENFVCTIISGNFSKIGIFISGIFHISLPGKKYISFPGGKYDKVLYIPKIYAITFHPLDSDSQPEQTFKETDWYTLDTLPVLLYFRSKKCKLVCVLRILDWCFNHS